MWSRRTPCRSEHSYDILGSLATTSYSSNVRSNYGYLSYANDSDPFAADKLFCQNGRKVFKEVCPLTSDHLVDLLKKVAVDVADVRRWWLHQANINMNQLIARRLLGRDPEFDEAPVVLDEYANTASAGSMIAFTPVQPGPGVRGSGRDLFLRGRLFRRIAAHKKTLTERGEARLSASGSKTVSDRTQ